MKYSEGKYSGSFVAIPEDNENGYKGREAHLCEGVGGRWVHGCAGYVISDTKRKFLEALVKEGWTANTRILKASKAVFTNPKTNQKYSYYEAKKMLNNL